MIPSLTGQHLGKYEILEEIGRGGFGVVYRARDQQLKRIVALKVLAASRLTDPAFVTRFKQEAQTEANLEHPGIVAIYELGEEQGIQYITMKFLSGQSLDKIIQAEAPLPLGRAKKIIGQVASALDYAHSQSLIHRDIKPSNIIIDDYDKAVLTDFGLVKLAIGSSVSTTGQPLGTPAYMSPEQADSRPVDGRTDVYALGVVLFEMLTGSLPFNAESTPSMLHKQVYEAPPSIRTFRTDLPASVEAVVNQALAKNPEERFQTPGEMLAALIGEQPAASLTPPSVAVPTPMPPPVSLPPQQPPPVATTPTRGPISLPMAVLIGVGALVVVSLIFAFVILSQGQPPAPTPTEVSFAAISAPTPSVEPSSTATLVPSPRPAVTVYSTLVVVTVTVQPVVSPFAPTAIFVPPPSPPASQVPLRYPAVALREPKNGQTQEGFAVTFEWEEGPLQQPGDHYEVFLKRPASSTWERRYPASQPQKYILALQDAFGYAEYLWTLFIVDGQGQPVSPQGDVRKFIWQPRTVYGQ
ncbi:MAG: protein kinase [Chloroflexi bacterium]|nr:protein kinase [Chloroflexota bacterium]